MPAVRAMITAFIGGNTILEVFADQLE